jgi:uncharacterized protein (TIGR02246 family)
MFTPRHALSHRGSRCCLALIASLCGCQIVERTPGVEALPDDAGQALLEVSREWDEAFNTGDVVALVSLYDENAVSMPFDRPAIEGRAAIEADFAGFFADFTARHETTIASNRVANDLAVEHGTYTLVITPRGDGEPVTEVGKHLVVRRLVDGQWKIGWEIWNRDAPEPAP